MDLFHYPYRFVQTKGGGFSLSGFIFEVQVALHFQVLSFPSVVLGVGGGV